MEGLFTPVRTSYRSSMDESSDALVEATQASKKVIRARTAAATPEDALEILKNEPDYKTLISTLRYLTDKNTEFNLRSPSPLLAQLIHVLVSDTVLNYWHVLSGNPNNPGMDKSTHQSEELRLLLSCLQSVPGLSAVLLSLKQHMHQSKEAKQAVKSIGVQEVLIILLQLLQALLEGEDVALRLWRQIHTTSDSTLKQRAIWQEFLAIAAGGKALGFAAEAESIINDRTKNLGEKYWIANGNQYTLWLAENISNLAIYSGSETGMRSCGELLGKSMRIGHLESFIKNLVISLLLQKENHSARFRKVISTLPYSDQKILLYSILKVCSKDFLSAEVTTEDNPLWWQVDATAVSSTAALISNIVSYDKLGMTHLESWLVGSSGAGIGEGVGIRRAVLVVLSSDKTSTEKILEKSLQNFGDQLYIKHTPTMQQEVHCQVLLLAAGYLYRQAPLILKMMLRSGAHLSVVSNRLTASSPRCRFLGMVVGEALSSLIDKDENQMDFKVEDTKTPEARWYKSLVKVSDHIGSLELLKSAKPSKFHKKPLTPQKMVAKPPKIQTGSRIIAIEEVETDEEKLSDDGLAPFAKPDSDAEDSDADPTLITRNKPTAPVYIRDLVTYLRDTENYDKQKLGLSSAAPLIRRKTNFGTEVNAHAEELATLLVGIQDKYEIENFQDMRLQGMIAILLAAPLKMGQWFSKTFFDGDFSISQRVSILTSLGLGARELGGFSLEDASLSSTKAIPENNFPSKTLPAGTHKHFAALSPSPTDTLSTQLGQSMIAPMAASLADKLTGPSILKIRTFSSRMEVEKNRKKPVANSFAKIVTDGFFFPLTGRFFMHLKVYGSSSRSVVFQPYLLAHFVKTLALLLHASGPSTLSLPQMTSEFWDLLLGLRAQSVGEIGIMEAVLFAFLTILEINEDKRRLVDAHGRQMLETQEWVEGIFWRFSGGGEEDEKSRMLAAGVLVRIREIVEKYQRVLMGDLASF